MELCGKVDFDVPHEILIKVDAQLPIVLLFCREKDILLEMRRHRVHLVPLVLGISILFTDTQIQMVTLLLHNILEHFELSIEVFLLQF